MLGKERRKSSISLRTRLLLKNNGSTVDGRGAQLVSITDDLVDVQVSSSESGCSDPTSLGSGAVTRTDMFLTERNLELERT